MLVKFKNTWFSPNGTFFNPVYAVDGVFEVDPAWRHLLPTGAKVVEAAELEEAKAKPEDDIDALLQAQENERAGMERARDAHNKQAELENAKARAARAKSHKK